MLEKIKKLCIKWLKMELDNLPHDKPRYLMGVGDTIDIIEGVIRGVDMFDKNWGGVV